MSSPEAVPSSPRRQLAEYGLLLLVVAASTAWSLARVGLFLAPARDEGHYVVLGWRCVEGERIYVDFYDGAQKPPLMYWTAGAAVKLVGRKAAVFPFLRAVTILVKTAALLLIFFIGRRLASGFVGLVGAALFGFHTLGARVGNQVMTEPYSALFALLGLWVFLKSPIQSTQMSTGCAGHAEGSRLHLLRYFASGLLLAVGMLYRPTPLFLAGVLGIVILAGKETWKNKLKALGLFAAGGLLGLMPLVIYLAANGGFYNFYVMVFRFMRAYPPVRYSLNHRLLRLTRSFLSPEYYGWLAALAVVVGLVRALKARSGSWLVLGGWLGVQLVMALTLRRAEWHYHYEFLPGFVLLFGLGFQRLLTLAKEAYVRLGAKSRAYRLIKDGHLLPLAATLLLPIPIWVLLFLLQSAAVSWRAGSRVLGGAGGGRWLTQMSWSIVTTLGGALLVMVWENRYKYHLFLFAFGTCSLAMLTHTEADAWASMNSGSAVSLCFTFALGGWLRHTGQALRGWSEKMVPLRLGGVAKHVAHQLQNSLQVLLWLFMLWLFIGQAIILVRERTVGDQLDGYPATSKLEEAEQAANYIRRRLLPGNEIVSTRSDIIFLVGEPFPTYWGAAHEKAAKDLGIATMVGRDLADMPGYFERHRVQLAVFAGGEPGLSREGERYLQQHFRSRPFIGPYLIYEREADSLAPQSNSGVNP